MRVFTADVDVEEACTGEVEERRTGGGAAGAAAEVSKGELVDIVAAIALSDAEVLLCMVKDAAGVSIVVLCKERMTTNCSCRSHAPLSKLTVPVSENSCVPL